MAISIDWATRVINVPRADLTLVQSNPVEVRELNLNQFRLALKDLEDDSEGMPFPNTHSHNGEVLLGGIVYARVIEIINNYTVTFEDGQYAVNLIGANSNVGDVVNVNQVSVRTANSAGLISNQAIEYASYNGGVTIDAAAGVSGTAFPIGTPQSPVNNIGDAVFIANFRGFSTIYVVGDLNLVTGDVLGGYELVGGGRNKTLVTIDPGASVPDIRLSLLTVQGEFDGKASFNKCTILDITSVEADISECILSGDITLIGNGSTIIEDSRDGLLLTGEYPTIDFNSTGHSLGVRDYHGDIEFKNKSGNGNVEVNISTGGKVVLDSTVSGGNLKFTGAMQLVDNSVAPAVVDSKQVLFPDLQQLAAFGGQVYIDTTLGSAGIKFPQGTQQQPINNIADAITVASVRNINTFVIDGVLSVVNTDISGFSFIGANPLTAVLNLSGAGNTTNRIIVQDLIIAGRLNGAIYVKNCAIQTLSNIGSSDFPSVFVECIFRSDVGVTPSMSLNSDPLAIENIHFFDCFSGVPGADAITFDINNSKAPFAFRTYEGGINIINYTEGQSSTLEINIGQVTIDPSCTDGTLYYRGSGQINDNSGPSFEIDTTAAAGLKVDELHKIHGLNKDFEVTLTKTSTQAGNINLEMLGDGENIIILGRT